jgi:hypothetical protein
MKRISLLALAVSVLALPAMAAPPVVPDNGSGTANLPPTPAEYVSPAEFHVKLKNGTVTIATADLSHQRFLNRVVTSGGLLGGQVEKFNSSLVVSIVGTGPLAGWSRTLTIPAASETHTAPRTPGDPVQSFDTLMYRIQGQIVNDPDFSYFRITAGDANGLSSPGPTTLYKQPNGSWLVNSNFQVKYVAEYKGSSTGRLAGIQDSFEGTITMTAVAPGTGTKPKVAGK